MQRIESPGLDRKWSSSKKSILRLYGDCIDRIDQEVAPLEFYVFKGVPEGFKFNPFAPETKPWQRLNLFRYATFLLINFEKNALEHKYDVSFAQHTFACAYHWQLVDYYSNYMGSILHKKESALRLNYTSLPYIALGVVIGCKEEAFRLARLILHAYRHALDDQKRFYPIFQFMLRILADYLNEPPHVIMGEALNEPIFNALFSLWREPDIEILASVCLAACDFHTHRCKPGSGKSFYEFEVVGWNWMPIEILLLFKLRQLLGLQNPVLNHPLMDTPLGVLPPEVAFEPDDLTRRVYERMRQDGYDDMEMYPKFLCTSGIWD